MQFFKLCDFLNIRGRWHLGEITGPAGDEVDMDRGQRIEHTAPLQIEVTDLGEVLDFCLTSFNAPVCNAKLAAEIGAVAGDDVQVIPVEINEQKGMVALNAVRVVPCIDEARSDSSSGPSTTIVRTWQESSDRSRSWCSRATLFQMMRTSSASPDGRLR
jgi:hypothetical protein